MIFFSAKSNVSSVITLCLRKPDLCYIFKKKLQQSRFNISAFWYKDSPFIQHLIAHVTLREILRAGYQLRFACGTHSMGNCVVILRRNNNYVSHEISSH